MKYIYLFLIIVSSYCLNSQCATAASFTVTPPTCSTCCNGSIAATHSCAITYTWMPGALTGASIGGQCGGTTYTLYVGMASTLCCGSTVGTSTVYLPVSPPCAPFNYSLSVTPESCTGCCDGTAQIIGLTGGCPPYSFSWSTFPVQTGTSVVGLCAGINSFTITDAGCCPPNTQTFTIGSPTGNAELNKIYLGAIIISPNPSDGKINVISEKYFSNIEIRIYDVIGKLILTDNLKGIRKELELNLKNGVYFITLVNKETGEQTIRKIVIQK